MGQGWKRLPLLVTFLLFWKNTDGFKGGAYSNAHHGWGQPSDTFSPHAVQSSMSEAHVTGTLPVEEVGSSLLSNKPLKSRSKFNLLQFVKGGSSSSQSTSHAQTAPGSSVSASWPQPLDEQLISSLTPAGSSTSGAASGLNLQALYAASGSGHLVSTQGGSSSYPAELGISGQSTSDGLHLSTSQETSVHQSAETSLPVFSQESISYSSSSAPGATSTSQSSPILPVSSGQPVSSQGEGSYSGLSQGASSPYTPVSLMSNKLGALPLGASSQFTSAQHSPSGSPSTQSRSGTQLATSSRYVSVQGGSSSTSSSHKPLGTLGQYAPLSPTKYVSAPKSSPQAIYSQATSSGSTYRDVSQVGSLSQVGASGQFVSQRGNYYSGLLPQSPATSSQYALGYSKPISSPQSTSSQSAGVLHPHKQYASASQGSSGAKFGASTGFASQGMSSSYSGTLRLDRTTSQFTPGSPSPYDSLYCKCAPSTQGVDRESTTVQSPRKQFTSRYGTQSGSSPFTLQGSIPYDRSPWPQGTASQLGPVSHTYPSVSSPSQGVSSQSVQFSRKQLASTYTGSSGTQGGSSTRFTLQGSTAYGGSPQPQDAASQLVRGSSYPYASVPLSSPQGAASQSSQSYQGYPVFQSRESKKWQPSATRLTPVIGTSDATASQGSSSSQSSPMQFSSLSSAGGSSRVSGLFVSARGGSTSYGGSFQSPSLSTKYTPVSQHLPYDTSVAGQGTSSASASEVLSSYSSMNNQNAPAHPSRRSSSSHFYSVKG